MNYIVMNGNTAVSAAMSHDEAMKRRDELRAANIYPKCETVPTDQTVTTGKFVATAPIEEVEDKGCAGGACTL